MAHRPFPDSFLFGVGTSDSQCEAYVPQFEDIRDRWYAQNRMTPRGKATDFWNRFPGDIALAKGLGCGIFRFSVAWARVEPQPGVWNDEAIKHYSDLIDAIRANGMEPFLTVAHFTWPIHIEQRGGLLADEFPAWFTAYTDRLAEAFGDRVKYWATLNEPNILQFGYLRPWWSSCSLQPPGLPLTDGAAQQAAAEMKLLPNVFIAHKQARDTIHKYNPTALVGANSALLGLPVWLLGFLDRHVSRLQTPDDVHRSIAGFSERRIVEKGKVDVLVSAFSLTAEREKDVDFGAVYAQATQRLLVPAQSTANTASDLVNKSVAVVRSTTAVDTLSARIPSSTPVVVTDFQTGLQALEKGNADAFLGDDVRLLSLLETHPGKYRILTDVLSGEAYAPAVTKGNPLLLDKVNQAVSAFLSSENRQVGGASGSPTDVAPCAWRRKSLGLSKTAPARVESNVKRHRELLDHVLDRGFIRVGIIADVPTLAHKNEAGDWSGPEVDLARGIARAVFGDESKLRLVSLRSARRLPSLRSPFGFLMPLEKLWALLTTSVATDWWQLGLAGKLAPFLCPTECVGQLDFVAIDYYWGINSLWPSGIIRLAEALGAGKLGVAPVYPPALFSLLSRTATLLPKCPVFVVENGSVAAVGKLTRADYLREHLRQVQKAVSKGFNIAGYICWSITSNRELGHPFSPQTDFGLYHIELDKDPELTRQPTPSRETYADIISNRKA
jgi:beta-glucosidase/6-phospho-beta-glucosidase/beta-galactosidase/ABC-type amino acid transport substrate-binding protein